MIVVKLVCLGDSAQLAHILVESDCTKNATWIVFL